MTDEELAAAEGQEEQQDEKSFEEAALENMESTLTEMHGELNDESEDADDEPEKEDDPAAGEKTPEAGSDEETTEAAGDGGEADDQPTEYDPAEDDKLAESMADKTRERFDHFRNENKEMSGRIEEIAGQYNELVESTSVMNDYIQDSQISPEQLSTALAMAKAINTGDFELARQAMPRMQQMMNHVAVGLGDPSAQVKMPDDLNQAVEDLDVTPEIAREIAVRRQQEALQRQYQGASQQQQAQQNEARQVAQGAASSIKEWEAEMVRSDPDFTAKRKKMLVRSEDILKNNHPSQWLPRLQEQYGIISETMQDFAEEQQRKSARNQGLRPGHQAGGVEQEAPKTLEEHMNREYKRMATART